jgi:hypothetical protein
MNLAKTWQAVCARLLPVGEPKRAKAPTQPPSTTPKKEKEITMNNPQNWNRIIAGALAAGAVTVAGFGLATGTAHAADIAPHRWCPGQPMPHSNPPLTWNMRVCHEYQATPGGRLVEGAPTNRH